MITVTADQALDLLRNARDDYGADYRDPNGDNDDIVCEYRYPDGKMCIAGHVLNQLGVSLNGCEDWEGFWSLARDILPTRRGVTFTREAIEIVGLAQGSQDAGSTWGEAVVNAERRHRELTRKRVTV